MNAITNNAHMQAVTHKTQASELKDIFARQGWQKLTHRHAHQDQATHRHDEIARQQKSTGGDGVEQILLNTEVGTPDQNQNERGGQRQAMLG